MTKRSSKSKCSVALLCATAAACVAGPESQPIDAAPGVPGAPIVSRMNIRPLVDAHLHVMSPMAMAVPAPKPPLPRVDLPTDIVDLLDRRQSLVGSNAFDAVFSSDAQIFAEEEGRWWRGKDLVARAVNDFPTDLRFVATDYGAGEGAGFISGYLRAPDGADTHTFTLGLRRRARDGGWLISSEMKQPIMPPIYAPSITAEDVIETLDDAGISKGVVLSLGYWFGSPARDITDRHAKTRAENDWTVAQAARFPDRLIPFCGVNPLADYALDELARCAGMPLVRGIKVHFNNARVDLANEDHRARLRDFFRAADQHRLAIVVHFRGDVETFVDQVLPAAPNTTVQIAHMASGWENLGKFADAIAAGKPGTEHLYFDWTQALPIEGAWTYGVPSGAIGGEVTAQMREHAAAIMRRVGLGRILHGTDMPLSWNPSSRDWWTKTVLTLPLTDEEIRDIADNVPPYLQQRTDGPG